jgi:hypothetical protein
MKNRTPISLSLALFFVLPLFTSCDKGDDPPAQKFEDPIVHLAGQTEINGVYTTAHWKNGVKTILPNPGIKSYPNSVIAKDGDVYISGIDHTNPIRTGVLWKNGKVEKQYNDPNNLSYIDFYFTISGNDQYTLFRQDGFKLTYYKNDQKIKEISGTTGYKGLKVSNSDVYIAGYKLSMDFTFQESIVWKNGNEISLPHDNNSAMATDVYVVNNDLYVSGDIYPFNKANEAILWKNQVKTILPSKGDARTSCIFGIGDDIYVGGYSSESIGGTHHAYWKNGTQVVLDNSSQRTQILDLAVSKSGKVYALGIYGDDEYAILWVDGKVDETFNGINKEYVYSIFLEEK